MVSEGSQTQKVTYCMIPCAWNIQNRQFHSNKADRWLLVPGAKEEWGVTACWYRVLLGDDENVWELHRSGGCTIL